VDFVGEMPGISGSLDGYERSALRLHHRQSGNTIVLLREPRQLVRHFSQIFLSHEIGSQSPMLTHSGYATGVCAERILFFEPAGFRRST
jgi:hypothetical protein